MTTNSVGSGSPHNHFAVGADKADTAKPGSLKPDGRVGYPYSQANTMNLEGQHRAKQVEVAQVRGSNHSDSKTTTIDGRINALKKPLGMGSLAGPALEKAVDKKIKTLTEKLDLNLVPQRELPDRIDGYIKTLETENAPKADIEAARSLKLAVGLKQSIVLKRVVGETVASAKDAVKAILDNITAEAGAKEIPNQVFGRHNREAESVQLAAKVLRDYSSRMVMLHGGREQDYKCSISLSAKQRHDLYKALDVLTNEGRVAEADVALIRAATTAEPARTLTAQFERQGLFDRRK